MDKISTQEQIKTYKEIIDDRIDRIANYLNKGMGDCAKIELFALSEYVCLQYETMMDSMPGKKI